MINNGASYSFIAESVVKSHWWLMDYTGPMSIFLATRSEVVSNSLCNAFIVFCDVIKHAIT